MDTEIQGLSGNPQPRKPLRLWPGIVIVILQWLIRFGSPALFAGDNAVMAGVFAGIIGGLAVVVWWAFFSRAPVIERWGAVLLAVIAFFLTTFFIDKSISTGNMGLMFIIVSLPLFSLVFVAWAVAAGSLRAGPRRITMVFAILAAFGLWIFIRSDGMTGHMQYDLKWRWATTQEEKFLIQKSNEAMTAAASTDTVAIWPGFRGPNRDGIIHGVRINTDWKKSPPKELWRKPIGPGCSSFAASEGLLYTQEQRGENEIVSCYNLVSGTPVWIHSDKARFWDSHAGAGPRGTPTLNKGRIFTMGGTGILNALNAQDGSVLWARNAPDDTKAKNSGWGFTSSPLVAGDIVVVATSGKLAAYDIRTGEPKWFGPDCGKGYSSPHLASIAGIDQILLMSDSGLTSVDLRDGSRLWEYKWALADRIIQPTITSDGDILVGGGLTNGTRSITVSHKSDSWEIKENWTSAAMKPYFNDVVVHKGHAYGFDGLSLACFNIKDGKRLWRGGRYGGQIILLADQDLMIVISEKGDLALVQAVPEKFSELGKIKAIEGKTWNHPVLAGDVLVVRNSEEMAAFRLL